MCVMCPRLLEATKDDTVMRSQDLFTVVRYVSLNPLGRSMAWDWTTLNWDYLVGRSVTSKCQSGTEKQGFSLKFVKLTIPAILYNYNDITNNYNNNNSRNTFQYFFGIKLSKLISAQHQFGKVVVVDKLFFSY